MTFLGSVWSSDFSFSQKLILLRGVPLAWEKDRFAEFPHCELEYMLAKRANLRWFASWQKFWRLWMIKVLVVFSRKTSTRNRCGSLGFFNFVGHLQKQTVQVSQKQQKLWPLSVWERLQELLSNSPPCRLQSLPGFFFSFVAFSRFSPMTDLRHNCQWGYAAVLLVGLQDVVTIKEV